MHKVINAITGNVYTDWYCEECGKREDGLLLWEILDDGGRPFCMCGRGNGPDGDTFDMVLSLIYQKGEVSK